MSEVTGKTLIDMGYAPGQWFRDAIVAANAAQARGGGEHAIRAAIEAHRPPEPLALRAIGDLTYGKCIAAETAEDVENIAAVDAHMQELMRVPTVRAGAVMPDACSAGSALGTIPVGGVVATENAIHPGMHSADICCSVAISVFSDDVDPSHLLDAGMRLSHFGGGGRAESGVLVPPDRSLLLKFSDNRFLRGLETAAIEHHATQGDGNHFLFVGRRASDGRLALVTHHGSRKPGAMLYKAGMVAAQRATARVSPETPRHNAWLAADSDEGRAYWQALQVIRAWTKSNHEAVHRLVSQACAIRQSEFLWNEHNFVFRREDGLFYHGKGATPAWSTFADDSTGLCLIPLNMVEPVLIVRGLNNEKALGFAPHGAGRNFSRSAYMRGLGDKEHADDVAEQTRGIDARFFCGKPDVSELPRAYKSAAQVRRQIEEFGLAEIVDTVEPIGCIMAGDWQSDAPWRRRKAMRGKG